MHSGGIFELLEDRNGNLLGTYGLSPLSSEVCELRKMYFLPAIRGVGLGRRVLERAVVHPKTDGITSTDHSGEASASCDLRGAL